MPRIWDPISRQSWTSKPAILSRDLRRGYLVPLETLVPHVPRTVAIYIAMPGGPRCTPADRLRVSVLAAQWWAQTGRFRWRLAHRKTYRVGQWVPRRAKRRKLVAHGRGATVCGAAAFDSEQSRAVERRDFALGCYLS